MTEKDEVKIELYPSSGAKKFSFYTVISLSLVAIILPMIHIFLIVISGILAFFAFLFTIGSLYDLTANKYTVEKNRVCRYKGLIGLTTTTIDFDDIKTIATKRGVLGTWFGFGSLLFFSAGTDKPEVAFQYISDPEETKRRIQDMMENTKSQKGSSTENNTPEKSQTNNSFCPKCGAEVEEGSNYCSNCGQEL